MSERQSSTADKNIVDRRRRRSASGEVVREARKFASSAMYRPIEYEFERLQAYAENHVNATLALPLFVLIVAIVSAQWVGALPAAYWTVTTVIGYGVLLAICHRFLKSGDDEKNLAYWRRRFMAGQLIVALNWSLLAIYHCAACSLTDAYSIMPFSALLVFQAVTMGLSHGFGASLLLTSAPPTILLAGRLMLSLEPAGFVMGGILIGAQVFFYFMADRMRLSILSALAHRHERENLIAELETARSMSDEARRRAEEANLAKSRFLATMSHELRTPLNAILGFSEVMQTEVLGPLGNETYKGYVGDIHASGTHLLKLINEILDLSRIEAGRQELREEAVRLTHVLEDARQMVALKARTKGVEITLQAEENMPMLWADERAMRQIALNLLSNALKFTPTGGKISITVGWTSRGGQYFSVRDTGPGIPEEEIPVVLSSFGQGSIAIKSAEQGTGLGLPIVQALVHMHDGRFDLKSVLREGTIVTASFPRSRVLETMGKTENLGHDRYRRPVSNRAATRRAS
ncbi:MAG: HAMP domain-containing histidine kinase [Nitratireductor sp.]|nr:HAMP domain-containing histidine kinase [Nitratireductor sp.]